MGTLSGTGSITADGGDNAHQSYGGGGGGGRIAIYCDTLAGFDFDFVTACGGQTWYGYNHVSDAPAAGPRIEEFLTFSLAGRDRRG